MEHAAENVGRRCVMEIWEGCYVSGKILSMQFHKGLPRYFVAWDAVSGSALLPATRISIFDEPEEKDAV